MELVESISMPIARCSALSKVDNQRISKASHSGNFETQQSSRCLAFDLQACDSHQTFMATPPALSSAWRAAEAVENYWMALLRDVNFEDYATNPVAAAAIAELNQLSDFAVQDKRIA